MKKMLLSIAAAALSASASAQYIIVNDDMPISINDIEKITYEADDQLKRHYCQADWPTTQRQRSSVRLCN